MSVFNKQAVHDEYVRLGTLEKGDAYRFGWSYMGTPESQLKDAKVVLVGLNPGGGQEGEESEFGELWEYEKPGLVHVDEDVKWGKNGERSPLQKQIRCWLHLLGVGPVDVAHVNFVPFRSSDWAKLPYKENAIEFSRALFKETLQRTDANLFITFGKVVAWHVADLLHARQIASLPITWKSWTIDVYDNSEGKRVVAMPHPKFSVIDKTLRCENSSLFKLATQTAYPWH